MATTLRLDEALYREAKAAAAKRGITITRWIEEALRAQLARPDPGTRKGKGPFKPLPSFDGGGFPATWEEVKRISDESQTEWDLKKLGWKR